MKRFLFSLEKLHNLRKFKERESEIALGKANASLESIQRQLDETAEKRVRASRERRPAMEISELLAIEHYITRLDKRAEILFEEKAAAELIVEQRRKVYIDAHRERQIMDKLSEKKFTEWKKESLSAEAAFLDDIINSRV